MSVQNRLKETDPDLAGAGAALKRAAANALKLAMQTNTPLYVFRDGKIINLREFEASPDPPLANILPERH
jgi:hypothetical protein